MQFKVPQDVQREDTIIGPLTLKQMGILGIGGGLAYAIYIWLSKTYFIEIWLPPVAIISAITLAFAFLKIHNLTFYQYLLNLIEYSSLEKKRIWIQGSDTPFVSTFTKEEELKKAKKKDKKEKVESQFQNLEAISKALDSHKETATQSDLSEEEKKEGLKKIINQNYKPTT